MIKRQRRRKPKSHNRSINTDRSRRTIHVTIRSRNSIPISKISSLDKKSSIERQNKSIDDQSFTLSSHEQMASAKVYNYHRNTIFDGKAVIQNHHRQLKKKSSHKKIYILILDVFLGILFISVIITIILLYLFLKTTATNRISVLRWNRTGITIAGNASSTGTGSNQLYHPWDLTLDWQGNLYVTDRDNMRVQKFAKGSKVAKTIAGSANGVSGSTLDLFSQSIGIVVDDEENIYVSDHNNHRVVFWARGSTIGRIVAGNGTPTKENNTLWSPHGLQRDSNTGILYIADSYNCRIMRYLPNTTSGMQVAGGSTCGSTYARLNRTWGFHLDLFTNSVIIANSYGRNVVRWRFGESNWTQLAGTLGVQGATSTTFSEPSDVTLDPMGNMYVADYPNHRIQFFWAGESNGMTIAGVTSQRGSNASLLYQPTSLILDNQLNMYVTDWLNNRIQKFLRY